MTIVQRFSALLLLAVWLPVTSHCLLERSAGGPKVSCCNKSSPATPPSNAQDHCPEGPCDPSGPCDFVESATYKADLPDDVVPEFTFIAVIALLDTETTLAMSSRTGPHAPYQPPDLDAPWQFLLRTALPVRAPALLS